MNTPKLFSVYMLDLEHGWHAEHKLSAEDAIRQGKDYRENWAGSQVALVPDGMDPDPFLKLAFAIA